MVARVSAVDLCGWAPHGRIGLKATEYKLHCQVAELLSQHCCPNWRYTHLPFGEKRDPATASKLKRMGVTKGWPDFMLVRRADMRTLAGGFVAFLELKSHSGRLSAEQADIAAHLMAAGFGYLCTSDFGDAFKALTPWGVIPANVRLG